jgi:hypothetical protein
VDLLQGTRVLSNASGFVAASFIVLPLLLAAAFLLACDQAGRRLGEPGEVRRRRLWRVGAAVVAWLVLTAVVAASGVLRQTDARPPPFVLLALVIGAIGVGLPFSPLGTLLTRGLPIGALVGFQVFRLPLELAMHRAWLEGLLPVQMTYSGRNFDILTGITAGLLGAWLLRKPAPRWLVAAWNLLGLALLLNIVAIAILSTPLFALFGPDRLNTFVTEAPFVWLPAVMVLAAFTGHLLVWRWLADGRARAATAPA